MIRLLIGTLTAATVLAVMPASCKKTQPSPAPRIPPGEVWITPHQMKSAHMTTQAVKEKKLRGSVTLSGKISFDDLKTSHVFSPVTGRVTKVIGQPGQRVQEGAPLLHIASPDLGQAFSDLLKAQADLVATQHEFDRQKMLYSKQAAPKRDLDNAEDNFLKAEAELERARQKARLLKAQEVEDVTQEYVLRSPIAGEIVYRNVNPGIEVQGLYSGGNVVELFTVGRLDTVWMLADVAEFDLLRVQPGASLNFRATAFPTHVFHGTVEWISASLDPLLRTSKVRCTIKNPDQLLKPEMSGQATIEATDESVLAIPRRAVLRLGQQQIVFVARGEAPGNKLRFVRRAAAIRELRDSDDVAVLDGLKPDDVVVVDGAILLAGE